MKGSSRLPGFYKVAVGERRAMVRDATGVDPSVDDGGLTVETADKFVENVIGTYALPWAVALNVRVDGRDRVVPMVVEEPSVVAAASNAARIARAGGGFVSDVDPPIMIAQVQLVEIPDLEAACVALRGAQAELLAAADASVPGVVARGGGARGMEVRVLDADMIALHVHVDCRDAMGANLVNTVAEAIAHRAATLARGRVGLRILSNLADRRLARVSCAIPADALATETARGDAVARGIAEASRFAELDPYRAATHNKGIMNGIDPVVIATGNDWRAVEAGAHAWAARSGRYAPLATWRVEGDRLVGRLELPMQLGTVGGTLRVHAAARRSLAIANVEGASDLAAVVASVGLASNLAALRALATDGIQRGHMALHARAVALAAGAEGELVDRVAAAIVEARDVTVDGALRALRALRTAPSTSAPPPIDEPRAG